MLCTPKFSSVWDPLGVVLQEELESVQKRAAIFVTGNYNYETESMAGILGQLKWNPSRKGGKTIYFCFYLSTVQGVGSTGKQHG